MNNNNAPIKRRGKTHHPHNPGFKTRVEAASWVGLLRYSCCLKWRVVPPTVWCHCQQMCRKKNWRRGRASVNSVLIGQSVAFVALAEPIREPGWERALALPTPVLPSSESSCRLASRERKRSCPACFPLSQGPGLVNSASSASHLCAVLVISEEFSPTGSLHPCNPLLAFQGHHSEVSLEVFLAPRRDKF